MQTELTREVELRIAEIRADSERLMRYDINGDGIIDAHEWEEVRRVVEAEVATERARALEKTHPLHAPPQNTERLEILQNRYELLQEIGRGAQGRTFLARDQNSHQSVAIKEMQMSQIQEWQAIERFEREAHALKTISHPAIPEFIDFFHTEADQNHGMRSFIVQEFIDGQNLKVWMDNGLLVNEPAARAFLKEMLTILKHLHTLHEPIIHSDIKPSNIVRRNSDQRLALIDFGAAQILEADPNRSANTQQSIVGTSGYMPLEQMMGNAVPATDLYALAATTVHLLSQRHPADLPLRGMTLQFREFVNVSEPFKQILEKMLLPHAEQRFSSVEEVLHALKETPQLPTSTHTKTAAAHPQLQPQPSTTAITFAKPNFDDDSFFNPWDATTPPNEPPPLTSPPPKRPQALRTQFNHSGHDLSMLFPSKKAVESPITIFVIVIVFFVAIVVAPQLSTAFAALNFFEKFLSILTAAALTLAILMRGWLFYREAFDRISIDINKENLLYHTHWLFGLKSQTTTIPLDAIIEIRVAPPGVLSFNTAIENNLLAIEIRTSDNSFYAAHRLPIDEQNYLVEEIRNHVFPPQN